MEMKLKKLLPLFGVLCASFCVSLQAETRYDNQMQQSNGMQRANAQGKQGTYQRGMYREITPDAGPRVTHGADVFLTADYLLWKLTQKGSNFADVGGVSSSVASPLTAVGTGTIKDGNFHWNSGFRVGIGLNLAHDGWDIQAEYTWLRAKSDDSIASLANVRPTFPVFAVNADTSTSVFRGPQFNRATTAIKQRYNVLNLELGRNFYVSQFLTLRPHFGLTGNWRRYRQTNVYTGSANLLSSGGNVAIGQYVSKDNNRTWGIGLRSGLDTAWHMSTQWSFFGDLALSSIWTCYDNSRKEEARQLDASGAVTASNVVRNPAQNKYYRVNLMGELEFGLRWEIWFYDDNYHFAAQLGWYEAVWVNHLTFLDANRRDVYYDSNVHGLNVKFRFDF